MSPIDTKPPPHQAKAPAAEQSLETLPTVTCAIDGCVLGHWKSVFIGVWAVPSSLELVQEQHTIMKLLGSEGKRFSGVQLVIKRAQLPSSDVREAYQELSRRYAQNIVCAAVLIEGAGFWASAVRAFLTGLAMLERGIRSKAFAGVTELANWVARQHNAESREPIAPEQLRLALEWMLEQPSVRDHRSNV